MSDANQILRGKGLIANPAFFMIFAIAGTMGIVGVTTIGISAMWGWILAAIAGALFAVAYFSGLGEKLFVAVIALAGLATGLMTAYVVFYLWGPMKEQYLRASLLALLMVVLPVASIAGERVLPVLIAFLAGAWGLLSIIVFVMVVTKIGLEDEHARRPAPRETPAAAAQSH